MLDKTKVITEDDTLTYTYVHGHTTLQQWTVVQYSAKHYSVHYLFPTKTLSDQQKCTHIFGANKKEKKVCLSLSNFKKNDKLLSTKPS